MMNWRQMTLLQKLLVVVALQTIAILGMVGMKLKTFTTGTEIVLDTEPIDPRSLFRGDFVRLRYEVTLLESDEVEQNLREPYEGQTIYVELERKPDSESWRAIAVHDSRPAASDDRILLRGRIAALRQDHWIPPRRENGELVEKGRWQELAVPNLLVYYGIEAYFVPEGEGRALERPVGEDGEPGLLSVRVAVDNAGAAAITGILINGKLVYEESLF